MPYRDPALDYVPATGTVLPASFLVDATENDEYFYGDQTWTPMSINAPWTQGTGTAAVRAVRIGRIVYLQGQLSAGTNGTTAFTLPVGYRPIIGIQFACCIAASTYTLVGLNAAGAVVPTTAPGTSGLFLNSISFPVV